MMPNSIEQDREWFLKAKPEELFEIFSGSQWLADGAIDAFMRELDAMTQEQRNHYLKGID